MPCKAKSQGRVIMQSLVTSQVTIRVELCLKASCKHMHSLPNSSSLLSHSCALYIQSSTPLPHSLVMQHRSEGKESVCR
jgi:hypothetical protein